MHSVLTRQVYLYHRTGFNYDNLIIANFECALNMQNLNAIMCYAVRIRKHTYALLFNLPSKLKNAIILLHNSYGTRAFALLLSTLFR